MVNKGIVPKCLTYKAKKKSLIGGSILLPYKTLSGEGISTSIMGPPPSILYDRKDEGHPMID